MRFYYPTDKNGNQIGFKTPESQVYDKNGVSLTDKLEDIDNRLTALYGGDNENQQSLSSLNDKIDATNTNVSNLNTTVQNNYNELKNKIDSIGSDDTSGLGSRISDLEDTVNGVNKTIDDVRLSVIGINNKIDITNTKVSSLDDDVDTLNSTMNSRYDAILNKFTGLVKVSSFDSSTGTLRLTSL